MISTKEIKQKAFTKVAKALLKQGRPAFANGMCRYVTEDDRRCAVGWLLSGKALTFAKDVGGGVACLKACALDSKVDLPDIIKNPKNIAFLEALQCAHDTCAFNNVTEDAWLELWKTEMIALAKRFKLNASVITGVKK
jgi:hypothetical protein